MIKFRIVIGITLFTIFFSCKKNTDQKSSIETLLATNKLEIEENKNQLFDKERLVDSVSCDLNKDGFNDMIVLLENPEPKFEYDAKHFNLPIEIYITDNSKILVKYATNDDLIFSNPLSCYSDGYLRTVCNGNFFTFESDICSGDVIISTYITIKFVENQMLLHKYGEEYFNKANHEEKIPAKIWSMDDFGIVAFDELNEGFFIKLRNTKP
ncbi:MAG: hypothetical protein AAGI25_21220 [Bacteroidota bacterium]